MHVHVAARVCVRAYSDTPKSVSFVCVFLLYTGGAAQKESPDGYLNMSNNVYFWVIVHGQAHKRNEEKK